MVEPTKKFPDTIVFLEDKDEEEEEIQADLEAAEDEYMQTIHVCFTEEACDDCKKMLAKRGKHW